MRITESVLLIWMAHWWTLNSVHLGESEFYWFSLDNQISLWAYLKDSFKAFRIFFFFAVVLEGETNKHDAHINIHKAQLNKNEERFKLLESACYNGKLIWKVTDYKLKKKEALDGHTVSIFSQPFYTSRCGYRLCARAYLNGDGSGKGTHLSLYFVVMRGEFDSLLQWPFRQRVTLMLLDQSGKKNHIMETFKADPNSSSFKRPDGEMNIASGCPRFVAHSTLENAKNTYIKDDTLFLKVAVDLSDLEDL